MKIHTTPTVRIISRPRIDWSSIEKFVRAEYPDGNGHKWDTELYDDSPAAEILSEFSGRLCYMSFPTPRPGGAKAYLDHVKQVGHGSILEHPTWSMLFTGVSRTLTHELVRHRAGWAFSQLSQRYVDESVAEYVEPDIIRNDPDLHKIWVLAVSTAHEAYIELVDKLNEKLLADLERRKAARQAARSVLPNATETKIVVTANVRAFRHFIEMRASRHAEPEIRKLAHMVWELLVKEAPLLFDDYISWTLPDGTKELRTPYRKV